MTTFQRALLGILAAALLLVAVLARYTIVIGARGDGHPQAYRLDRWTGDVKLIAWATMRDVGPPTPGFEDLVPAPKGSGGVFDDTQNKKP